MPPASLRKRKPLSPRTLFWLGFASAYALAAVLFAFNVAATNPKRSLLEAVTDGVAWPLAMTLEVLEAGWPRKPLPLNEHCRGRADCDAG